MARIELSNNWTRDDRNAINKNFDFLFNQYMQAGMDAEEARKRAVEALANSVDAKDLSERTQKELSQAILEGDSSPLAGQLSVGADGTVHHDPQERLVKEHNAVSAQLAHTETKVGDFAINARDFGVRGDGVTDNTEALTNVLNFANGRQVILPDGETKVTSEIEYSGKINLTGSSDKSVLDLSSGGRIRLVKNVTTLPSLSNDIRQGRSLVKFATAHNLSPGDVFIVYNPTDFSFAPFRSYYRDGCIFKVDQVLNSSELRVFGASPSTFKASDMQVFKMNGKGVSLSGFKIKPNPHVSQQVMIDGHHGVNISDVEVEKGSLYTAIEVHKCFDIVVKNLHSEVFSGDAYPLSISNSQKATISQSSLYSARHAIALGGRTGGGAVPTRDILIDHCILKNRSSSGIGAADIHGNCENVVYSNCFLNTGANMAGKNVKLVNCTIVGRDPDASADGNCIFGSEVVGGVYEIENCRLITSGNGSSFGTIHFGVSNISEDLLVSIKNVTLVNQAGSGTIRAVSIGLGSENPPQSRIDVEINGLRATKKIFSFLSFTGTNNVRGVASAIVDNVHSPGGCSLVVASNAENLQMPMRLQRQTGRQTLTATSGTTSTTGEIQTFNYPYPRSPYAQISVGNDVNRLLNGNRTILPGIFRLSATNIRPFIATGDATNWNATAETNVMWTVGIDEL